MALTAKSSKKGVAVIRYCRKEVALNSRRHSAISLRWRRDEWVTGGEKVQATFNQSALRHCCGFDSPDSRKSM